MVRHWMAALESMNRYQQVKNEMPVFTKMSQSSMRCLMLIAQAVGNFKNSTGLQAEGTSLKSPTFLTAGPQIDETEQHCPTAWTD